MEGEGKMQLKDHHIDPDLYSLPTAGGVVQHLGPGHDRSEPQQAGTSPPLLVFQHKYRKKIS